MSKKTRVALHGVSNSRGILIDANATEGAIVGRNLLWPNGDVVTEEELRRQDQVSDTSAVKPTLWSLIFNIPAIIDSLVALTTNGWIRNDSSVISASYWPYIKASVDPAETVIVPINQQMLFVETVDIQGALDIEGTVAVL